MKLLPSSILFLGLAAGSLSAAPISIPNFSFENPTTTYADFHLNDWHGSNETQSTSSPVVGVFLNPEPDSPQGDHIDNMNGNQAGFFFPNAGVNLYQTLTSPGAIFDIGTKYTFTLAMNANSQATPLGSTVNLRLFYLSPLDGSKVYLATTAVIVDAAFKSRDPAPMNHLYDYFVSFTVPAGATYAGRAIGIEISAGSLAGGYWDFDNARLDTLPIPEPRATLLTFLATGTGLSLRRKRRAS